MRIALLFDDDAVHEDAPPDEASVLTVVRSVDEALRALGHEPFALPVDTGHAWLHTLRAEHCDLVFNLCEAVGGRAELEPAVAALVELLGMPMTGCSAETIGLARRKDRVNAVLAGAGLPVPAWMRADHERVRDWDRFPAIVKPAGEDASVGIHQTSVASDDIALERALRSARSFGPLIIQEYIEGREFNVGFLDCLTLPVSEIDFAQMPDDYWRIVSYNAKWAVGSIDDVGSQPRCPAPIADDTAARLAALAGDAWRSVDGRGYGRVDLRVDLNGQPWLLEVNPNPDLSTNAGLARMASAAGIDYTSLVGRIIEAALA